LSRFLIYRSLRNPQQIGHYVFWHIKAALFSNMWYYERFALFLEEYLCYLPIFAMHKILKQYEMVNELKIIAFQLRQKRDSKRTKKESNELLSKHLVLLNYKMFGFDGRTNKYLKKSGCSIPLPLNPAINIKRIKISKCSMPCNKKIILTFIVDKKYKTLHLDESDEENMISVLFKYGDDLKHDVLTTNLLAIMDMLWLRNNLDLKQIQIASIQTGSKTGFLSITKNAKQIEKDCGINSIFANHSNSNYANCHDPELEKRRKVYARSTAGYCVASWILGVAQNKMNSQNIMIHSNGSLFYMDFARHILSNDHNEKKAAPFFFTNYMKFALETGQKTNFCQFVTCIFEAFCILRQKYKLLLSLLLLMLSSPQIHRFDPLYLQKTLKLNLKNNTKEIAIYIEDALKQSLKANHLK